MRLFPNIVLKHEGNMPFENDGLRGRMTVIRLWTCTSSAAGDGGPDGECVTVAERRIAFVGIAINPVHQNQMHLLAWHGKSIDELVRRYRFVDLQSNRVFDRIRRQVRRQRGEQFEGYLHNPCVNLAWLPDTLPSAAAGFP